MSIERGGVYAAGGAFFAAGSLPTRAKMAALQILRPDVLGLFDPNHISLSVKQAQNSSKIRQRGGIGGGSSSPAKNFTASRRPVR